MQTAVEWLIVQIKNDHIDKALKGWEWLKIFEQAKEMEKQQMQDFGARCCLMTKQKNEWTLEQLYNETYGSKGSDELHEDNLDEIPTSSQTTSDKWKEYQDWLNEVPQISDEEIEKAAENYGWRIKTNTFSDPVKANELAESAIQDFKAAIKWYREQLKKKQ